MQIPELAFWDTAYLSVLYCYLLPWRSTIAIFKIPVKSSRVQIAHRGMAVLDGRQPVCALPRATHRASQGVRPPNAALLCATSSPSFFAMNSEDCYRYCLKNRDDMTKSIKQQRMQRDGVQRCIQTAFQLCRAEVHGGQLSER